MSSGLRSFARFLTNSLESVSTDGVECEYVFFGKMDNPDELMKANRWEDQEQWRILVPCQQEGREINVRIRCTKPYKRDTHANGESNIESEDPRFTLTIKSYIKGQPDTVEAEVALDPAQGEKMLAIFREEGDGMVKRRYFFPVGEEHSKQLGFDKEVFDETNAVWEVDVFWTGEKIRQRNQDDAPGYNAVRFHPYVKLDLEVRSFDVQVDRDPKDGEYVSFPIPFPIELTDVVYSQPHQRTERDKARVEEIMDKYMVTKK